MRQVRFLAVLFCWATLSPTAVGDENGCRVAESGLSETAAAYLESNDLSLLASQHPNSAIAILAGRFEETRSTESAKALAELVVATGTDLRQGLPNALVALKALHHRVVNRVGDDGEDPCLTELYNLILTRVVLSLEDREGMEQAEVPIAVETLSGEVRLSWHSPSLGAVWGARSHRLIPADEFDEGLFEIRAAGRGIGAPFLALRRAGIPEEVRVAGGYFPDYVFFYPVTIVADVDEHDGETKGIALRAVDPLLATDTEVSGRRVPISFDITAQADAFLALIDLKGRARLGLRRAERLMPETGIFLTEPFRPDKIPVVFVHGLDAAPMTWIEPYNALLADPKIREHYQFWSFNYPSGLPFLYSAHLMRQALLETVEDLESEEAGPYLDRMVLVGHSMGGLLCRLQATSSGDSFFRVLFAKPLEELDVTDQDAELIRSIYFVEPLPFVSRLVFVATPHRGSELADGFLGKLGAALVHLPKAIEEIAERVIARNKKHLTVAGTKRLRAPDSIERLSARDPILLALDSLPPAAPFHSIIGDRGRGDLETSSDGVVVYESSHLDGAESELIVPAEHNAHQHAAAVEELRRILLYHLEEGAEMQRGEEARR